MATAKVDTINGTGATLTSEGWVITQKVTCSGLVADDSPVSVPGLVSAAYAVLLSNNLYIGKFLEFNDGGWPIVLDQMDFSTLTQDHQEVYLTWRSRRFSGIRANFTSAMSTEQTNKDYAGNIIKLQYTYPADHDLFGKPGETGVMVNKIVPEITVDISRTEWGPTYGFAAGYDISRKLLQRKLDYEGKINNANWSVLPGVQWSQTGSNHYTLSPATPMPANNTGCWLCMGINSQTNDCGVTYDVTYTFAYRKPIPDAVLQIGGWEAEVVFVDPTTGKPVPNPGTQVIGLLGDAASRVVGVYESADFYWIWGA